MDIPSVTCSLFSTHQALDGGVEYFVALCGMLTLMTDAPGVNGTTPQLTPKDVHIEVSADSLFGSLPVNRGLTVSVDVPESPVRRGERLVAVFETPTSAPYTVPLEIDHARHHYSATVDLGRLSGTLGTPPKATTLQVLIGRQQELHVEATRAPHGHCHDCDSGIR